MLKNDVLFNILIFEFFYSVVIINVLDVKFIDVVIYFFRESW